MFKQNIFPLHQSKMKTCNNNKSYLLNRQQWSFDLQSSQCQDTVQQEGATTNQIKMKLYSELHDNNTHIYIYLFITFYIE